MTVIWNVIPWWNYTRKVTGDEVRAGAAEVLGLVDRLPKLQAIVLVGTKAARAKPYLEASGKRLFMSDHPSPIVRATVPERWSDIPAQWGAVRKFLVDSVGDGSPKG